MDEREFKVRTRKIALRVIRLRAALPKSYIAQTLGKQLLGSGTSIGANYRAACRSKSALDMIAKLGIVEEEADETLCWIDLLLAAKLIPSARVTALEKEVNEILAMGVASIKTLRSKQTVIQIRQRSQNEAVIQNPKSKIINAQHDRLWARPERPQRNEIQRRTQLGEPEAKRRHREPSARTRGA